MRFRIGVLALAMVLSALSVSTADATIKKFAVTTTVEAELGPEGKPTGYLIGTVRSKLPWCERKASVSIGSSPEDTGFGAETEANGKGEWRAIPGELTGRTVVVIVRSPNGYGPKLGKHTQAACKSFRTTVHL